ncbi:MAG: hypothetical protein OHK0036_13950 [Bacteroidia bacterium]
MKRLITKIGMYLLAAGTLSISSINAQNVGINSTGSIPNNSAGLDVDFTNKGLLIPRVALTGSTDNTTIPSPATSLLVFHTGGGGLSSGYYYNAGTPGSPNWVKLFNGGSPADAWLTLGNAGTTPGTHFIGTTDNVDLVFKTNNIERARITNAGRVGINTSTPGSYYLDVLSNNSAIDGIRGQHTSGSTASAFAAITGSVSNSLYTAATGYLGYHNSNNVTFAVYGNGGDLAGMFNGKVGINSVSTNLTNYDLEIRNNGAANPVNTLLRATAQKPNINDVLTNLDFGDSYVSTAQAKIQVIRDAAASSVSDLPTAIGFWTTNDGTSTPTEKMRITNNGNVGIGTTIPNNSALLHVSATNKGVIFPKVGLTGATDNITVPVSTPTDDGMLLYNTSTAGTGTNAITPGYYYWQNNRWTKFQTSGYAGIVFGSLYTTAPNHISAVTPAWQYTNAYIDLPPGKWIVYSYQLITPYNTSTSSQGWDVASPAAIWVRTSLSNSSITFSFSSDIIGSPFISGSVVYPSNFGMTSGAVYVVNNSGTVKRYYLWAQFDKINTTNVYLMDFATTAWGENQFFAMPAE